MDRDRPALVDRNGTLTTGALADRVARLRAALAGRGVGPGDAVLVVAANDTWSAAAYHAVVGRGATAVMTQAGAGASERRAAVGATRPGVALLAPAAARVRDELALLLPVEDLPDLADRPAAPVAPLTPADDAPRLVVFTSGTTATPKGVVHSAGSLRAAVANFRRVTGLLPSDRLFLVSPLASITGVLQALELAPAVGAAAVLEDAFDDEASLDLLLTTGGTVYGGPDLVLDRLLAAAARRAVGVPLRLAALGGTMLRRELLETAERFGVTVVRVYGSSEVPVSTGALPGEPAAVRLADDGAPNPGVELRLADDGAPNPGVELLVRGPHRFLGYVDPADTAAAVVGGWFRTGDAAELTGGRLRIVGRITDVASRNGRKVSLAEVDAAFAVASGIPGCAAFAVPDAATGDRVGVAVHLPPDAGLDVPAVLAAMEAAGLARWKLPECVVALDAPLPVTPTGKVRRRELGETGRVLWRAPRLTPDHDREEP